MENMAMQLPMLCTEGGMVRPSGRAVNAVLQGGGDPFQAIIQNMIQQMEEDGGAVIPGQLGTVQEDQLLEDPTLMEGFAAMLFANPAIMQEVLQNPEAAQAALQNGMQNSVQNVAQNSVPSVPNVMQDGIQNVEQAVAQSTEQPITQNVAPETAVIPPNQATIPLQGPRVEAQVAAAQQPFVLPTDKPTQSKTETITGRTAPEQTPTNPGSLSSAARTTNAGLAGAAHAATTGTQEQETLQAQQSFRNAVTTARRMLREESQSAPQSDEKLDIDKLQSDLSTTAKLSPFQTAAAKLAPPKLADPPATPLEQLKLNLAEQLPKGAKEFTVKLKPETLGEITVKLMEKEGKMTLQISTANPQTARMLNQDLSALREAVRPMQVEVHEVVSQTAQSNQSQSQQFNMSNQQFAQQQQQQSFHGRQTQPRFDLDGGFAEELEEPALQMAEPGLSLYI